MIFKKTNFSYFKKYCIDKFGNDAGNLIFTSTENMLSEMMKEADYRNSKYIKWHMETNMLPVIAMYLTFKKFDQTANKELDYTNDVMQIYRIKMQKRSSIVGSFPFGYHLFKTFSKSIITKQYPEQGWDIQWTQHDSKQVHFDMKRCIYVEITKQYNCAELCSLFCANDDVILAGYGPAIVFERENTIAGGHDKCDFHFKNSKYI